MALEEHDRDDLFAEARALPARGEWQSADGQVIVAGLRGAAAASFFFGPEAVYHFNERGELRRAYVAGRLIKAEQGRLASLERRRTARETQLLRHDLTDAEQAEFLRVARERLLHFWQALRAGLLARLRREPPTADVETQLAAWLEAHAGRLVVAAAPHVGG